MKTTIDIPDTELREVIRNTGAKTKREAVVTAIADYNRRKRAAAVLAKLGTFDNVVTQRELRKMRGDE